MLCECEGLGGRPSFAKAARLLEADKFESVLMFVHMHANARHFAAATHALRCIDTVLLHGEHSETLTPEHLMHALSAARILAALLGVLVEATVELEELRHRVLGHQDVVAVLVLAGETRILDAGNALAEVVEAPFVELQL